jgi:hypothetical protein
MSVDKLDSRCSITSQFALIPDGAVSILTKICDSATATLTSSAETPRPKTTVARPIPKPTAAGTANERARDELPGF